MDIPNTRYYLDSSGALNLPELARARGSVVHVSLWKTTLAMPLRAGAECTLKTRDDGNASLPPDARYRLIGSDHGGGKVLLERAM